MDDKPSEKPQPDPPASPTPAGGFVAPVIALGDATTRWGRFVAGLSSEQLQRFALGLLTVWLLLAWGWRETKDYLREEREAETSVRLAVETNRYQEGENEKNRQSIRYIVDSLRFVMDNSSKAAADNAKATREMAKALGQHSATIAALERTFRAIFPGKILLDLLPAYFGASRTHVAPPPRPVSPLVAAGDECPAQSHTRTP